MSLKDLWFVVSILVFVVAITTVAAMIIE